MFKAAPASAAPPASLRPFPVFLADVPDDIEATPDACGCRCDASSMERHMCHLTPRQRAELAPRPAEILALLRGADIDARMRLGMPHDLGMRRWWCALLGWKVGA